ncbi:MAG: glucosaminidase domain-containing protein, partial [Bacteroidota bacterium]
STNTTPQPTALGRYIAKFFDYAIYYGVEILLIFLILYLCISRGLSFSVDIYDPLEEGAEKVISEASIGGFFSDFGTATTAIFTDLKKRWDAPRKATSAPVIPAAQTEAFDDFNSVALSDDPAPHISNLTLVLSPDYGQRKGLSPAIITAKKARVKHYLDQYAPIAQREMKKYGIPASITLAQGLLESNAGDSKLAVNSKNHFGIKCRKKCLGCTCRNYGDDTRYDMFRVFTSAAESFREHSTLLNTPRYAKLKAHGTDYKKWAHGLKSCGYATDKRYGYKLITIIENLDLTRYDG